MKPLDYLRCADCHTPSCEGCDNTVTLTRADLMQLKAREAIVAMIWRLFNDTASIEDDLLNSSDSLFQGIDDRLDRIKDDLMNVLDRLSTRMEDAYGYEMDKF